MSWRVLEDMRCPIHWPNADIYWGLASTIAIQEWAEGTEEIRTGIMNMEKEILTQDLRVRNTGVVSLFLFVLLAIQNFYIPYL